MKQLSVISLAALALSSAIAAEVVVYAPYDEDGFTLKAPSGTYRYDKSFTGHRAVVTIPAPTNAVIEAWSGTGDFALGKSYGTSAGYAYPTISLTCHSPVLPRLFVQSSSEGEKTPLASFGAGNATADRGHTIAGYCKAIRDYIADQDPAWKSSEHIWGDLTWCYTNLCRAAEADLSSLEKTRVRLVRWAIDDIPIYKLFSTPDGAEVVFDKKMILANRAFLTEADILADGGFDLDWAKLKSEVVDDLTIALNDVAVTNVSYIVVIGDGKTYWRSDGDTDSCPKILNFVIERKFTSSRVVPTPLSAMFDGTVAQFKFRIDGDDVYDDETPSFTAFQVGVRAKGASSAVWTSGVRRLPAKMQGAKVYSYVTDDAALASAIASGKSYEWVCALYNAKFSDTPAITDTNTWSSATFTVK